MTLDRHKKELEEICKKHNITLECVLNWRRLKQVKSAKVEIQCYLRHIWNTYEQIAKLLWYKSHASIRYNVLNNCSYSHKLNNVNIKLK